MKAWLGTALQGWSMGFVLGVAPAWVKPSMSTGSVMVGRPENGWMVWGPAPEMLNAIVSVPGFPFACVIAHRSEPVPESWVLLTVYIAAPTATGARTTGAATAATKPSEIAMSLTRGSNALRFIPSSFSQDQRRARGPCGRPGGEKRSRTASIRQGKPVLAATGARSPEDDKPPGYRGGPRLRPADVETGRYGG